MEYLKPLLEKSLSIRFGNQGYSLKKENKRKSCGTRFFVKGKRQVELLPVLKVSLSFVNRQSLGLSLNVILGS